MQNAGYGLPRMHQPVEKVGIELIATPNRARNAPKAVCLVPFGARSWVKAATKDVFQQPDTFHALGGISLVEPPDRRTDQGWPADCSICVMAASRATPMRLHPDSPYEIDEIGW